MSLGNLILNAIGTGIIILIYLTNYQRHLREHNASLFLYFLIYLICFFLPALLVTLLFLYLEKISCCSCCVSPGKQLRVFDPDHPEKTFIMEEGRVVELMQTMKKSRVESMVEMVESRDVNISALHHQLSHVDSIELAKSRLGEIW